MKSFEQIDLYTVPGSWVHLHAKPSTEQYQRVVGIKQPEGVVWSKFESPGHSDARYSPEDAEVITLQGDEIFNSRLLSFFTTYLSDPSANTSVHNCHRFGWWMRGSMIANSDRALSAPDEIVAEGFKTESALALGQRGIIGYKFRAVPCASHSVVGLGENTDSCIQILASQGYMGISTYAAALEWYRPNPEQKFHEDVSDFGLYV